MSKWNDFFRIVGSVAPLVLSEIPGSAIIAPIVAHAIETAEGLQHSDNTPLSGAEKKSAALSIVNDGLLAVNAEAKKTVIDPSTVADAVSKGIDATVDVANLVHSGVQATGHYTMPQATAAHLDAPSVQMPQVKSSPLGNL